MSVVRRARPGDFLTLLPTWAGAVLACVPNLVVGVLLLVFRRPISTFLTRVFGRLASSNPAMPKTVVIVAGVFLIVVAGGLLTGAVVSALSP